MSYDVSIEDAFREACTALGESIVRERLLHQRLTQDGANIDDSRPNPAEPDSGAA